VKLPFWPDRRFFFSRSSSAQHAVHVDIRMGHGAFLQRADHATNTGNALCAQPNTRHGETGFVVLNLTQINQGNDKCCARVFSLTVKKKKSLAKMASLLEI
jgi:hypothetical protein